MRNWRITWLCIAICGFPWLVFPAKAQQPEWSSATLTGRYAGNGTWDQKIRFDLRRHGNKLVGTYLAQSETGPGKLVGKIALDGSIELHEVEYGNVYATFTLRKSSAGSYGGEWLEVGKAEAYNLQLAPLAVAQLPSSSNGYAQSKVESAVERPARAVPRNTSGSLANPIGSRGYSAHGYASSSDKATASALLEPEPTLPVEKNEAKAASRFAQLFEQFSAENMLTALAILIVFIVIVVMLVISVIYSPLFRREDNPLSQQGPSNPTTLIPGERAPATSSRLPITLN